MVARRWGMIPAVQPSAAYTLAVRPCVIPVETVNITPVPGMRTTMREVMRNSTLIMTCPYIVSIRKLRMETI